jgi:hypothetical protein
MNTQRIAELKSELALVMLDIEEMWMSSSRVPYAVREGILREREATLLAELAAAEKAAREGALVLLGRPARARGWARRAVSFGFGLVGWTMKNVEYKVEWSSVDETWDVVQYGTDVLESEQYRVVLGEFVRREVANKLKRYCSTQAVNSDEARRVVSLVEELFWKE